MHDAMIHSLRNCDYSQGNLCAPRLPVWKSKRSLPSAHVRVTDCLASSAQRGTQGDTQPPQLPGWLSAWLMVPTGRPSEAGPWGSLRCPEATYAGPTQDSPLQPRTPCHPDHNLEGGFPCAQRGCNPGRMLGHSLCCPCFLAETHPSHA